MQKNMETTILGLVFWVFKVRGLGFRVLGLGIRDKGGLGLGFGV